jgi:putative membrane protein
MKKEILNQTMAPADTRRMQLTTKSPASRASCGKDMGGRPVATSRSGWKPNGSYLAPIRKFARRARARSRRRFTRNGWRVEPAGGGPSEKSRMLRSGISPARRAAVARRNRGRQRVRIPDFGAEGCRELPRTGRYGEGAMKTNSLFFSFPLRFAAGAFALLFASTLSAQTSDMPMPPVKDETMKYADRNFLKKAAKAGEEEVNISTVAMNRSVNPQVKEFAQMIVSDHESIATQLSSLAVIKGVDLPAKETAASKWEKKGANDFDQAYLKAMVDQHGDAVELFAKAAKSDDAQIAAFASQQLPMLQSHLSKAKALLKTLE